MPGNTGASMDFADVRIRAYSFGGDSEVSKPRPQYIATIFLPLHWLGFSLAVSIDERPAVRHYSLHADA
jgi:hypothetical protein